MSQQQAERAKALFRGGPLNGRTGAIPPEILDDNPVLPHQLRIGNHEDEGWYQLVGTKTLEGGSYDELYYDGKTGG